MHGVRTHALCMTDAQLSDNEVRRIRERLGWSQPTLARRMGIGESTVRAWESGQNPCRGAAAVLLRVLERDPLATARVLERGRHDLPSPHAEAQTEEWFQLQRLLWLMSRVDGERAPALWAALVAAEGLRRQWLDQLEDALLIGPARVRSLAGTKQPDLRATTKAGEIRFHLAAFEAWLRETWEGDTQRIFDVSCGALIDPSGIATVPVMNAQALDAALAPE